MSSLTGKSLKGHLLLCFMQNAKANNSYDDFLIIRKEKDRHLVRLKESIFINHFKPSLNTKDDNAKLVLSTQ